jgi:hypothetical protein
MGIQSQSIFLNPKKQKQVVVNSVNSDSSAKKQKIIQNVNSTKGVNINQLEKDRLMMQAKRKIDVRNMRLIHDPSLNSLVSNPVSIPIISKNNKSSNKCTSKDEQQYILGSLLGDYGDESENE